MDCGIAVNSDVIKAQMKGSIGFGLGAILYDEITVDAGRVEQSNFHDYPMLCINEMPKVEVGIVHSTASPTGVGEPGVPTIGPAVANAELSGSKADKLFGFRRTLRQALDVLVEQQLLERYVIDPSRDLVSFGAVLPAGHGPRSCGSLSSVIS